jgi:hypothetical protein
MENWGELEKISVVRKFQTIATDRKLNGNTTCQKY